MFEVGTVLYLNPFYFKNGNTSKNKYFIILKNIDDRIVIASLPTSICNAPSLININHGCNNDKDRCFNCYAFESSRPICTNGFSFPVPTFIYGNEVEDYEIDILSLNHKIEGVDYTIKGKLNTGDYNDLIICLRQSTKIRRGIKKLLI